MKLALLVFCALGLVAPDAYSFPQYSLKEGKKCMYCHYSAQGGPTNSRGRYYGKHFSFEGFGKKLRKK